MRLSPEMVAWPDGALAPSPWGPTEMSIGWVPKIPADAAPGRSREPALVSRTARRVARRATRSTSLPPGRGLDKCSPLLDGYWTRAAGRMLELGAAPTSCQATWRSSSAAALRGRRGVAAALWCALTIEREAVTSPAAGCGAKAAPSAVTSPALGADAGQQEDRVRHQLAQPREELGRGGAGDGADVARARSRRTPGAPSSATIAARRSCSGSPGRAAGPGRRPRRGSRCARAEAAGARGARGLDQRLERVAAEQRVGREGVRAEAGHLAERPGVAPTSACA